MRVAGDLEGQRRERLGRVGVPLDDLLLVADRVALEGRDVGRRREVGDDRVEQGLHALVLERGATQDRVDGAGQRRAADGRDQLLLGGLSALQVELHQLVVVLGDRLDEAVTPLTGGLGVVGRDVDGVVHLALRRLGAPDETLHPDEVDDALEVGLDAPRQLNDSRMWRPDG